MFVKNKLIMYEILLFIFFVVAITLIVLIMLHHGKGIDAGSSFSTNASNIFFGSGSSSNFIIRMIVIMATLFFIVSLMLGNINSNKIDKRKERKLENINTEIKSKQTNVNNFPVQTN